MEEKIYTLFIQQADKGLYEVTVPEMGATKRAPTLDSARAIAVGDILKHLTTRYLILAFIDKRSDEAGGFRDSPQPQEADLEQQVAFEMKQRGLAPPEYWRGRHLIFELTQPLSREQSTWLDEHVGKLFDWYYTENKIEVKLDELKEW